MRVLNIQQAKTHLSRLVEQALAGEQIVIAKAGRPLVQLTPWGPEDAARTLGGAWEGKVRISADFDAPDPAVLALFEDGAAAPAAAPRARKARGKQRKRS